MNKEDRKIISTELEINRLLHEKVMGKCWHEWYKVIPPPSDDFECPYYACMCGEIYNDTTDNPSYTSSWTDYGPMLEVAARQEWWGWFLNWQVLKEDKNKCLMWIGLINQTLLNPLRGSTAIARFITEHKEYFKEEPSDAK